MANKKRKDPGKAQKQEQVANPDKQKGALEQYSEFLTATSASERKIALQRMGLDQKAIKKLNAAVGRSQRQETRKLSETTAEIEQQLAPQYADLYMGILDKTDPEFRAVRDKLGRQVGEGLDAGYELGDALSAQIEDDIRGAQTARGNWMGPAVVADEAFGKARARLDLYEQRQGQASRFLNGTSATDKMGAIRGSTAATQFFNPQAYRSGYDPGSKAMSLSEQEYRNQANAFTQILQATNQRNAAAQTDWGNEWSTYMFREYQQPRLDAMMNPPKKSWFERAMAGAQQGAQEGSQYGGMWGAIGGAAGGFGDGAMDGPIYQAKMGDAGQYNYGY